jgi:hypothetical protein
VVTLSVQNTGGAGRSDDRAAPAERGDSLLEHFAVVASAVSFAVVAIKNGEAVENLPRARRRNAPPYSSLAPPDTLGQAPAKNQRP